MNGVSQRALLVSSEADRVDALGAVARHLLSIDVKTITGEGAPKKERSNPTLFLYISQCAINVRAFQWRADEHQATSFIDPNRRTP